MPLYIYASGINANLVLVHFIASCLIEQSSSLRSRTLQFFDKFLGRILSVPLRVVLRPPPEISAHRLKGLMRCPSELLVRSSRVGCEIEHITSPTTNNLVRQIAAHSFGEVFDHLEDSGAPASAQIPSTNSGVL